MFVQDIASRELRLHEIGACLCLVLGLVPSCLLSRLEQLHRVGIVCAEGHLLYCSMGCGLSSAIMAIDVHSERVL